MANPTHSDLHVQAALTNLSIAFSNEDNNSVFDKVFPTVPVTKQADKYFVYDREDWLRTDAKRRAPGAEIAIGGYNLSEDSYFAERYGLGMDIDDPSRANADPAVSDLDGDAVAFLTEDLRIRMEKDWAAKYFVTGVWTGASSTTDMTGVAAAPSTATEFLQWNDDASTPIQDIRGEITSVAKRTGRKPNSLTLGVEVWTVLEDHPDLLDRIKFTEKGIVTTDLLASLLGLSNVWVGNMTENTAAEGGTASFSYQIGKSALLAYVAPNPGLRMPSAGYTFAWTGMAGSPSGGRGARIKRYRLERNESDRIEAEIWKDFKVVSAPLGAFFTAAVA